jgi:hypothetical protein
VSLNGWPVLDDGDPRIATGVIPGTDRKLTLARACLPLFLHFCAAWNKEMPARLKLTDHRNEVDGHEVRQARNANAYSNHASGTAVDLAYRVLWADNQRHMTDEERTILKRILSRYVTSDGHWVLGNGYAWGKVDEMHTELNQSWEVGAKRDTTAADVQNVIKRLGIKPDGTTTVIKTIFPPKPAPVPAPKPVTPVTPTVVSVAAVQPGKSGPQVGLVQKALNVVLGSGLTVDGSFGPKTQAAYSAWQRNLGYTGSAADGAPGTKSLTALGSRYGFTVAPEGERCSTTSRPRCATP